MGAAEQFEAIQNAIASLPSATDRAASAMEIFGLSGSDLLTLFLDTGAMGRARDTIGTQAEILERNARRFDRISDLLKSMGVKFRGFFVGIAEKVAPSLQKVLEEINKIDLSKIGAKVGNALLTVVAAIRSGRTVDLLKAGMRLAMASAVDVLMRGVRGAVAFAATALPPVFDAVFARLKDPNFWKGVVHLLEAAGHSLQASILEMFGKRTKAELARESASAMASSGMTRIEISGAAKKDLVDVMSEALVDGAAAAAEAASGPPSCSDAAPSSAESSSGASPPPSSARRA